MGWLFGKDKTSMVSPEDALPGRATRMAVPARHAVLDAPLGSAVPRGKRDRGLRPRLFLGRGAHVLADSRRDDDLGRLRGRIHPEPDLRRGLHRPDRSHRARARRLRPATISYEELLRVFWEGHDPTQGMRQGNDVGTQYRSAIYYHSPEQEKSAPTSRDAYQKVLAECRLRQDHHRDRPRRRLLPCGAYHQQYLYKNPGGYCGIGGTSVKLGDPSEWAACQAGLIPRRSNPLGRVVRLILMFQV